LTRPASHITVRSVKKFSFKRVREAQASSKGLSFLRVYVIGATLRGKLASKPAPSLIMKAATLLLGSFVVAIVLAFAVTVAAGTYQMQAIAAGVIVPVIALSLAFVRYCRMGRWWSYAGASALGAFGVALRLIVSTQPSLEVGGGLPLGVDLLYVALGCLVALTNYEAALDLRAARAEP
jgi:hypothetical protein